jgi:hypothetical protein
MRSPSKEFLEMKITIVAAAALLVAAGLSSGPANAADGCVKGAVIGGVAGHVAGHHGLLGAGAGCLIGRHEENRRDSRNLDPNRRDRANGSSFEPASRYGERSGYSR